MANRAVIESLDLGKLLKIVSTKGVYNQLSEMSEFWKMTEGARVAKPEGRETRYNLRTAYGQSAFQFLAAAEDGGTFPEAERSTHVEAKAYFKDFGTTIDVPRNLMNKTGSELAQYADPLLEESEAKFIATARGLSRMFAGDGSGTLGVVASVTSPFNTTQIQITLSVTDANGGKSHIGNFEFGEKVLPSAPAGTQRIYKTASNIGFLKVVGIDEDTDKVTFDVYSDAGVLVTDPDANCDITAADVIHPYGDGDYATLPDLTSPNDYGLLSDVWAGLESLAANDGRTVWGIDMEGAVTGTVKDAGGDPIDRTHFQSVLSTAKRRVGKGRYAYKKALMFDTVYDAMMESWETDRMIISQGDKDRGTDGIGYKHGKDRVEFLPDEFAPKQRIWLCPEGDVLQFRGTSIDQVEVGNSKIFMPNDSNGRHKRILRSYLEGTGLLQCVHPAAVASIRNFTV